MKRFVYVFYFVFLGAILFSTLIRQININYLDYGEGSYLYEAWRFLQGERLYVDFLVPQPPVLFLWGAFLMKLWNSILFIRSVHLVLLLVSNTLFFLILRRVFNHSLFAVLASIVSFFLPMTTLWWPTFTAETLLRVLFLVIIYLLIPFSALSKKKMQSIILLSIVSVFTKYTALPFIIFVFAFIFLAKREYAMMYVKYTAIGILVVLLFLQTMTNGNYIAQTFFIRKNLFVKVSLELVYNITLFMLNYVSLAVMNFLFGLFFLKKKWYEKSLVTLLPVLFIANIVITFFQGTYNYIFYPVEPFFLVGFLYLPFAVMKAKTIPMKPVLFGLFLLSVMNVIFFFQSRQLRLSLSTYPGFTSSTKKITDYIMKNSKKNQAILAPPYYAYLTGRKLSWGYADPFLLMMLYLHNRTPTDIYAKVARVARELEQGTIPVVVMDWRLMAIREFMKPLQTGYKQVAEEIFAVEHNIIFLKK